MDLEHENTAPATVVKATGLTKEFHDFWRRPKAKAVNDIDFDVREGEVFGLLGPNGSGKSTTLKMILGLLYPTRGTVTIFGKSPRDVKSKSAIGYLPEESYLYKYLTAYETLDFFGAIFSLSAEDRKKRAEQLLEMVGLSHVKNRRVGEFSKGMSRRIGLAQAMINDPDLLILDEPTSGLDPLGCKEIKDLIKFLKKRGKTVIISSHLLSDVQDLCDRVIILYGGKIRGSGTLDELLTVSELSRIITPLLAPDLSDKIVEVLKKSLGNQDISIDHPKRSLEDYFLEVVNKARNEKMATSGVSGGGEIAGYLKEQGDRLLEQLTEKEAPPAPGKNKLEDDRKIEEALNIKLESLTKESPEIQKDLQHGKEDLSEINSKLSNLIDGGNNKNN